MGKTLSALTLANLELDRRLYEKLLELGIVQNQSELGYLCGKTASYYGCMRYKGFGLKIGSLTFLRSRLVKKAADETDAFRCINIRVAIEEIGRTIDEKCKLQEYQLLTA